MMKKYFLYRLIGLALLVAGIASCNTADQDVSPIVSPSENVVATFTPAESYSAIAEGDTVVYTITTNKMLDRAMTFNARIVSGTIDEDDIEIIKGVVSPYTTEATLKIVFLRDWSNDNAEAGGIEIGIFGIADRYLLNPSVVNPIVNVTVSNFVSDTLNIDVYWDQDVKVQEIKEVKVDVGTYFTYIDDTVDVVVNGGDEIDWDLFISEADGFDITSPWASNIVAAAATGDHPEVFEIEGWPNGEYVVWADLWSNGLVYYYSIYESETLLSLVANFRRQGTDLDMDVVQDPDQAFPLDRIGYADDDVTESDGIVARFIVEDGKYTVIDTDDTEVGPYKASSVRAPRPEKYIKTK